MHAMKTFAQRPDGANNLVETRGIISGLKQAFDLDYPRLLEAWKREWQRTYAGKDPSDACVSVRISSGSSRIKTLPCGGILKKSGQSFLKGNRSRLGA
jgi:transposase-like protein